MKYENESEFQPITCDLCSGHLDLCIPSTEIVNNEGCDIYSENSVSSVLLYDVNVRILRVANA